jgi:four helix bundle protein
MTSKKTHKDFEVWKRAVSFATSVYDITNTFPKTEQYGLISQLRRASVSISSNIAEGAARRSTKEFIQFLYQALGSATEIETQLIISKNLGYMDSNSYEQLSSDQEEVSKMLIGTIRSLKNKM